MLIKIKKIAATYIAAHMSEEEIEKIHNLFLKIDRNNDGFISF
jgi:Ca2+-binding EF-hand superfamily protein